MDETKTILEAAVQAYADEDRRDLGEHPSVEELSAYRAGELSAAESESLRDHLALCHMCTDLLLDLASFPDLEAPHGIEPVSRQEVDAAWREMGPDLLTAVGAEPRPFVPDKAEEASHSVVPAPRQPGGIWATLSRLLASPRFAYGLAALFLLAVPLTRTLTIRELSQPQTNVPITNLVAERNRSGPQTISLPAGTDQSLLVLNVVTRRPYTDFVVEMLDPTEPDAPPRWRQAGLQQSDIGNFNLLVPRQYLPRGTYLIRLLGRDGEATESIIEYMVQIEHQ